MTETEIRDLIDNAMKSITDTKNTVIETLSKAVAYIIDQRLDLQDHKVDKETPQMVTHEATIYEALTCPRCKNVVSRFENWGDRKVRILYQYCPFCGQHLKGEDEK